MESVVVGQRSRHNSSSSHSNAHSCGDSLCCGVLKKGCPVSRKLLVILVLTFGLLQYYFLSNNSQLSTEHLNYLDYPKEKNSSRILCLILSQQSSLDTKATAVYNTWGRRCTYIFFILSEISKNEATFGLPVLYSPTGESRDSLWGKTKFAFTFAAQHYLDKVDWVMKADDDTYVIIENLLYVLEQRSPDSPFYVGALFAMFMPQGYMSGGSGYTLSRKAVEMVAPAFKNSSFCKEDDGGNEDVEMGKCLQNVGVKSLHARDDTGEEETYFPLPLWNMMDLKPDSWLYQYLPVKPKQGLACCSERAISFHYINMNEMYNLEYLIYKLKVIGLDVSKERIRAGFNFTVMYGIPTTVALTTVATTTATTAAITASTTTTTITDTATTITTTTTTTTTTSNISTTTTPQFTTTAAATMSTIATTIETTVTTTPTSLSTTAAAADNDSVVKASASDVASVAGEPLSTASTQAI